MNRNAEDSGYRSENKVNNASEVERAYCHHRPKASRKPEAVHDEGAKCDESDWTAGGMKLSLEC